MGQPAALIAAATILFATAPQEPAPEKAAPAAPQAPAPPPPRAPIAGVPGFDSLSKVVHASTPETVHELKVTCAFPERTRWMLSAQVQGSLVREITYQYGAAAFRIPNGTGTSQVCTEEERRDLVRRMELRRALMLYPDGFAWTASGETRTASLGELGTLRARATSEDGSKPTEIECLAPDGSVLDAYRAVAWKANGARSWPRTMELWRGAERVWTETVESVDTTSRFVESFFLPPDRREGTTSRPVAPSVRTLDVPATCVLRTEIAAGTSWDTALGDAETRRAACTKVLAPQGLVLEPIHTFEVDETGAPIASVLRLTTVPETTPADFARQPARKVLATSVEGLGRAGPTSLAELRKHLPPGSAAGRPYVRFDPREGRPLRVVVLLPFDAPR